ncbi:augurin-A [Ictalurus punctatus]|uniref:Augurin-A n=1 Tax=Ictalurus punctatus TaxID=7998 RepID=A0A2D0R6I8_ICTPU|nr:augurin-A [Ictalurus punctatus]
MMMYPKLYLRLFTFLALIALLALSDVSSQSTLHKILKKREVDGEVKVAAAVAVPPSKAKQFLASLRRPKRNLWDRSRPDVQQWIQQFMYMGYDEARLETDLAYWMDHARSTDQGRQHHYDENSPMGPRYSTHYRHGANVNYDYY